VRLGGRFARALPVLAVAAALAMLLGAVATAQPIPPRLVQADDGSLYLIAGGQRYSLQPDPISDDELEQIPDGGELGSLLPVSTVPDSPPAPSPTVASRPAVAGPSPGPTVSPQATVAPQVSFDLGVGTQQNPIPVGTAGSLVDGWALTVTATQPSASVPGATPPAGHQFFLAQIQLRNLGAAAQVFRSSARLRAVGIGAVPYLAYPNACGALPDALPETSVGPGATIAGNVCWSVQSKDATTLLLYDSPPGSGAGATRVYFALHR
jgi:hypothetical protein